MSIYHALAELEASGGSGALCSIIRSEGSTPRHVGSKMLVYADGKIIGTVGGGELEDRVIAVARQAIEDGKPQLVHYEMADPGKGDPGVCGGQLEVFVEPIKPRPTLIVVGAGHVGKAVTRLGSWLGFRVLVSDDRLEFCSPEVVPDADAYYPVPMADLPSQVQINSQTYLVLCTRNVDVDVQGLPAILETPAAYIGVIGSRRRWATTRKQLGAAGISGDKLDRVISPMGLELNAETPEEIAVSILAEIVMIRRGGDGSRMAA